MSANTEVKNKTMVISKEPARCVVNDICNSVIDQFMEFKYLEVVLYNGQKFIKGSGQSNLKVKKKNPMFESENLENRYLNKNKKKIPYNSTERPVLVYAMETLSTCNNKNRTKNVKHRNTSLRKYMGNQNRNNPKQKHYTRM